MPRFTFTLARLGLAASALVGTSLFAPPPAAATATAPVITRLGGPDPAGTAAAVSAATFSPGVATAFVATETNFPDALAGGAAAGAKGPILLVDAGGIPVATNTELNRLKPGRIVVLGGTAAVSEEIATALEAKTTGSVVRWSGDDRYATAAKVSSATFGPGVGTAFIATGVNFPDALAGGTAAAGKSPILLTATDAIPAVTATELTRLAPKRIVVLGGTSVVSDTVTTALDEFTAGSVTRIAGADRYATAAAIARTIPITAAGKVFAATGESFTDALVGVPAAVKAAAPMVLAPASGPTTEGAKELARRGALAITVVGNEVAFPQAAEDALAAAAFPTLPTPNAGAATAVATAQEQLGKPYLWGGSGPDSFDCSGLTSFAWKAANVVLPHNSAAQQGAIDPVPVTMLEPGDLIFYGTPVHHVGIYVGEGQMVEAPNEANPVRTASIWRSDLVGAGRPGV